LKIPFEELKAKLPLPATPRWPQGVWDIEALKHGSMSVVLFAPQGRDYQDSHGQDELYVVLSGHGTLVLNDSSIPFSQGDVLFVPAGEHHHFESFSPDFVTWAIFWGPSGGERQAPNPPVGAGGPRPPTG
jgi:mannose-6-phosphate isomerase-like protein (cupin superfamily)